MLQKTLLASIGITIWETTVGLINITFSHNPFINQRTSLSMYKEVLTKQNNKVLRLTFSYEGSNIQLISQQKIEKVLPPSGPSDNSKQNQTGFWYELTDSKNNTLYRQVMDFPIKTDTEVFSNASPN